MAFLSARTFIGRAIAPRARCCGLLSSLRLAVWAASDRTWSSSGGVEDEHPLPIPRHGHKAPLATHFFESPQRKLTESEHGFDDAEHWFRGLLAQGIERPAFRRLQPMRPRRDRRRIFWRGRRRREAFLQRWMMRLTAHGDQRFDPTDNSLSKAEKSPSLTAATIASSTRWLRGMKAGLAARMAERRSVGSPPSCASRW